MARRGGGRDTDGDGLGDRYERRRGTNRYRRDTDRDRIRDDREICRYRSDPRRKDTDGDHLSDRYEILRSRTSVRAANTDEKTRPRREYRRCMERRGRGRDKDRDGLSDRYERRRRTDRYRRDTDRDRIRDDREICRYKSDPTREDTDRDGLSDRHEILNSRTDVRRRDTDGDGIADGDEIRNGTDPLDVTSGPQAARRPVSSDGESRSPEAAPGQSKKTPTTSPDETDPIGEPAPLPEDDTGTDPGGTLPPAPDPIPVAEASVFLDPGGSDTNPCTQAAPCLTLAKAYATAMPGDTVEMGAGKYPASQTITCQPSRTSPDDVLFRPATGATAWVPGNHDIKAAHITFDGIDFSNDPGVSGYASRLRLSNNSGECGSDITLRGVNVGTVFINAADDIQVLGSNIGPSGIHHSLGGGGNQDTMHIYYASPSQTGAARIPERILIEGNYIHDAKKVTSTAHSDCLQVAIGHDISVRGNTFVRCGSQTLVKGDHVEAGDVLRRILWENNFMDKPGSTEEGVAVGGIALQFTGSVACDACTIRNNTVNDTIRTDLPATGGTRLVGNLVESVSTTGCSNGIAAGWAINANAYGSGTCGTKAFSFTKSWAGAFVNATPLSDSLNLHLLAGSEAIGRGDQSDHPDTDYDGDPRAAGEVDAGADER